MSKLYKANHFKPLSQLKLLGEFAKIWFGKNFPVAVLNEISQVSLSYQSMSYRQE